MKPPRFWSNEPGQGSAWASLLSPAAALFRGAVAFRNQRFNAGHGVVRAPIPVISIGGLTVGGGGKTPATLAVARLLTRAGLAVAVASRGYGGRPGPEPRLVAATDDWRQVGDEPVLLARELPGIRVYVHPDRTRSAALAAAQGAQVLLLDDGFQHRILHRDLDLVALDAAQPVGNGRLLPAGPLREPMEALSRAGVVWLSRVDQAGTNLEPTRALVARHAPEATLVEAEYQAQGLVPVGQGEARAVESIAGARVHLLAGIALPQGLVLSAEALGAQITGSSLFPDHHPYRSSDLARVEADATTRGASLVLTTAKDAIRMQGLGLTGSLPILYLDVRPVLVDGVEGLQAALLAAVGRDS